MRRQYVCSTCLRAFKGTPRTPPNPWKVQSVQCAIRPPQQVRSNATRAAPKNYSSSRPQAAAKKFPLKQVKQEGVSTPGPKDSDLSVHTSEGSYTLQIEKFPPENETDDSTSINTSERNVTAVPLAKDYPDPQVLLDSIVKEQEAIAYAEEIPPDWKIILTLEKCRSLAEILVFGKTDASSAKLLKRLEKHEASIISGEGTSTSSLLDNLEEGTSTGQRSVDKNANDGTLAARLNPAFRKSTAETLTKVTTDLLKLPFIFITPEMLDSYVRTVTFLGLPEHLPEIFYLYANKPLPNPGTYPVTYRPSNPNSIRQAIPKKLADAALDAAIAKKDLSLALAVIDTTYRTPAFLRRVRLFKAGPPIFALSTLPFIAFTVAHFIGNLQNTMDTDKSMTYVFAGFMTYFITCGIPGYVATTTWNHHMDRVHWAVGTRMFDRFIKEDERAAFDKIAIAWGYKDRKKRGEETGPEWEALRELIWMRSMQLDRTEHMEGMK
ncbi:MAG: hypothetical protein Q9227_006454 [Pyrenula ochraceoflavens]